MAQEIVELKMHLYLLKLTLLVQLFSISAAAISGELPSDPFVSIRLLATDIKVATGDDLSHHFISLIGRKFLPDMASPSGTYSDPEIKAILSDFDRILEGLSKPIDETLTSQHEKVRQTVSKEVWPDVTQFGAQTSDWYKTNQDFLTKAETLSVLANVLWVVAPEKISFPATNQPEYDQIFGSLLGNQRYQIQVMLNSKQITPLLPTHFDVAKLRQQELEIREMGRQVSSKINFPSGQFVRTTLALRDWVIPAIGPHLKDQVLPELERLAARTRCLATQNKQQCR